jgi:hypothetical protein
MMVLKIDSFLLISLMQKAFKATSDTLNFGLIKKYKEIYYAHPIID